MAIQVGGTTVINDSRQLQNIASLDSASSAIISSAASGVDDYYDVTTTSLSPVINGGSSPYVGYQGSISYAAGPYTLSPNDGPNAPWWNMTSSSRVMGGSYIGGSTVICAKVGSSYFALCGHAPLTTSTSADLMQTNSTNFNNTTLADYPITFTMTSAFTVAVCFGTWQVQRSGAGINDRTAYPTGAITAWGTYGSYRLNSGSTFGFRLTASPVPTLRS